MLSSTMITMGESSFWAVAENNVPISVPRTLERRVIYGAPTYDFTNEGSAVKVSLSIGSAQGDPTGHEELYALISLADKALYVIKKRTHSIEGGGHERRN